MARRKPASLWILAFVLCGAGGLAFAITFLPLQAWLMDIRAWVTEAGTIGLVLFVLLFVVATATVSPAAPFAIGAGLLFGVLGMPIVLFSATGGAVLAFYLSRYLFRQQAEAIAAYRPIWRALDRAVAQQGWRVVLLVRLSPLVPFNVQNWLFGISRVRIIPYTLATLVGVVPNTGLYVYAGTLGRTTLDDVGSAALLVPAIGVICLLAAVFLVTRAARRALTQIVENQLR